MVLCQAEASNSANVYLLTVFNKTTTSFEIDFSQRLAGSLVFNNTINSPFYIDFFVVGI
jgi:hypothetical protein